MKIAVFHNFIDNIGGAEIVTLTLARELNADVFTTNINPEKIKKMGFEDVLGRIHSIGKIPLQAPFRHQLALWKFRRLNLGKKYDFYIISGDWAVSSAVNHHPNLWYVHSPLNELWEFKDFIRQNILSFWKRPLYDLWVHLNRFLTKKYAAKVDSFICNSNNTKERVKKYYKKDARIIYPPIDIKKYRFEKSKGYWLSVNRLISHKRVDLQIDAFKRLPAENLIIVGSYEKNVKQFEEYKNKIEKYLPDNVHILNWVDDHKLSRLYAQCKGFITTARNEDFGMTAVEAMASGKPVIAPNDGGYKESVIDGETGILIDNIDSNKILKAIKNINKQLLKNPLSFQEINIKQSQKYSTERFIKKIKRNISF